MEGERFKVSERLTATGAEEMAEALCSLSDAQMRRCAWERRWWFSPACST